MLAAVIVAPSAELARSLEKLRRYHSKRPSNHPGPAASRQRLGLRQPPGVLETSNHLPIITHQAYPRPPLPAATCKSRMAPRLPPQFVRATCPMGSGKTSEW